jgi:XisH protein
LRLRVKKLMAKDRFHDAVRTALEKEGWTITADPYQVSAGDVDFEIDLAAQMLAAERAGEKIAVEIKSFIGRSNVSEFHTALGQFLNYQFALEEFDPQRKLYLAIPESVYQSFFQRRFTRSVVERTRINLLVYNEKQEVIVQWQ